MASDAVKLETGGFDISRVDIVVALAPCSGNVRTSKDSAIGASFTLCRDYAYPPRTAL